MRRCKFEYNKFTDFAGRSFVLSCVVFCDPQIDLCSCPLRPSHSRMASEGGAGDRVEPNPGLVEDPGRDRARRALASHAQFDRRGTHCEGRRGRGRSGGGRPGGKSVPDQNRCTINAADALSDFRSKHRSGSRRVEQMGRSPDSLARHREHGRQHGSRASSSAVQVAADHLATQR